MSPLLYILGSSGRKTRRSPAPTLASDRDRHTIQNKKNIYIYIIHRQYITSKQIYIDIIVIKNIYLDLKLITIPIWPGQYSFFVPGGSVALRDWNLLGWQPFVPPSVPLPRRCLHHLQPLRERWGIETFRLVVRCSFVFANSNYVNNSCCLQKQMNIELRAEKLYTVFVPTMSTSSSIPSRGVRE